MDYTPDEVMVVCISRQILDGSVVTQGLATPLVAAAYLLALHTHAPNLYFASAIGQGICHRSAPLSIINIESLWLDRALNNIGFVRAAVDILPTLKPIEFFRPAQVDEAGNFNNIAFGNKYLSEEKKKPRLRLPGSGGIPDVTTYIDDIMLYVPRHTRATFVDKIDVCSGLGYSNNRRYGSGPKYLISEYGQFNFENGRMQLFSYHMHTSIDHIKIHTGFNLQISKDIHLTEPPSNKEITLLRKEIDPLDIRKLEFLSGAARKKLLHEIIQKENNYYQ